ncbi:MAG: CPBP family intramembrane metalloprotease [Chlorobi bacterium]|nr:CPBP family intramembrane metalloprotease [Chlorobiota bacterium]
MRRNAYFEYISPWGKLLLILGLVLLFSILTSFGGLLIGKYWLGTDLAALADLLSHPVTVQAIQFTKFFQFLNQLGVFIIPVFMYAVFVSNSSSEYLGLRRKPMFTSLIISVAIVFTILPFLNYISDLNANMKFPEGWSVVEQWMAEKEAQAKMLTEAFLKTTTIPGLAVNLVIVALIPALGEEMLFRGVLLRLFNEAFKNVHVAVFVSAFVFSLIHLQFFGFLPRLIMGLILGYLFVSTKNLWYPIAFHFVNNAASVIIFFLYNKNGVGSGAEGFGASNSIIIIVGSLLVSVLLLLVVKKRYDVRVL